MKQRSKIAVFSLAFLALAVTSCNKYEEGSNFTLYTKKARMVNEWTLESTQVNSINPSSAGSQVIALNNSNLDMILSTVFASTSGMINTNPDQGIVAANMSTATINNSTITVGNGIDNGGTQRGIDTSVGGANSSVTMNLGSITVANSTGNTSAARLTFGPNISLDLVSCTRNGAPVPC